MPKSTFCLTIILQEVHLKLVSRSVLYEIGGSHGNPSDLVNTGLGVLMGNQWPYNEHSLETGKK